MSNSDKIAAFISRKRKEKKLTQKELADRLNISYHGGVIIGLN